MTSPSYDWIAHHAVVRGDKVAAHDLASGRKFTYSEMNDRNSRLASALREEFGIERGDRVAVLAENDTNFFEVQFACWKLGAIFVPLNWRLSIPELEYGQRTPLENGKQAKNCVSIGNRYKPRWEKREDDEHDDCLGAFG